MKRLVIAPALPITALLVALVGCVAAQSPAPSSEEEQPAEEVAPAFMFAPDQYPVVHAATVDVLRDHGFRIARNDYRFGRVTTYSKGSPTAAEFWINDQTTRDQHRADTLNAHQRAVSVTVEQREPRQYALSVEVYVERLQKPARYLTHSARGPITAEYAEAPAHWVAKGIVGDYTYPLERDPQLEARLLRAIASAAQD